jgi:RNA polymerase sigma-70 factor (ECF subfamily)
MLQVKAGQVDQLGLLFERYHRILFSFFYNLNRNVEMSEDLVQNVFMRILKYKHRFKGDGEFKTWMFHIAKNVNIDYHKKHRKYRAEDVTQWQDKIKDESRSQNQQMIKQEELNQLKRAIQLLDPEKREIIILSKLQGLKYKEIGQIIGCSEGTVKVKVFRALKELKKVFEKL